MIYSIYLFIHNGLLNNNTYFTSNIINGSFFVSKPSYLILAYYTSNSPKLIFHST